MKSSKSLVNYRVTLPIKIKQKEANRGAGRLIVHCSNSKSSTCNAREFWDRKPEGTKSTRFPSACTSHFYLLSCVCRFSTNSLTSVKRAFPPSLLSSPLGEISSYLSWANRACEQRSGKKEKQFCPINSYKAISYSATVNRHYWRAQSVTALRSTNQRCLKLAPKTEP